MEIGYFPLILMKRVKKNEILLLRGILLHALGAN